MSDVWTISFGDAKKRLDVFLSEKVAGLSRAQAKKRVEAGGFTVNGKPVSGHHFLKEGDIVAAVPVGTGSPRPAGGGKGHRAKRAKRKTDSFENAQQHLEPGGETVPALSGAERPLRIVEETPDWIVVYKPAGVLMHPDTQTPEGTLIDAVITHAPQVAKIGEDPVRPGIVSRLDKDVSGLVVIAKTQAAFEGLKRQFAEHSVTKEYFALVH
ncbi:MAG TPA: pseudouridine synthase, partial [Candidatus Methylomirabilis sp.]|nr:pseudouridine synthase [Candidatus Methylomirabilis sp.]